MNENDLVIVGAGPAGITAAVYAARAGLKTRIFDGGAVGGTLNSLDKIENYPGFASITGAELARNMRRQLKYLGVETDPRYISNIIPSTPLMCVVGNEIIEAKYVILATGLKRNKPEYARAFEGKGVSYCAVCDGNFYKGKTVCVIGNGTAAREDAAYLSRLCKTVYLITENETLPVPEGVIGLYGKVVSLHGNDNVEKLVYSDGENHTVDTDGVFIATGTFGAESIAPVKTDNGFIITDEKGKTDRDAIYAVGDVVSGSLKQIVSACSMGAIAATDIIKRLKAK